MQKGSLLQKNILFYPNSILAYLLVSATSRSTEQASFSIDHNYYELLLRLLSTFDLIFINCKAIEREAKSSMCPGLNNFGGLHHD